MIYDAPFLLWWGLLLFLCRLGSRRELDFELGDEETGVLQNVNRLAETAQDSLPVHGTLAHYLEHLGPAPLADLRARMIRRLIRQKVLDGGRLLGRLVVALDGTGHLAFQRRHCPCCITQTHGERTYYLHPVLEAKVVARNGLALSMGTEFIANPRTDDPPAPAREAHKQDGELRAFARLADQIKAAYGTLSLCLTGDALFACGPVLHACEQNRWAYVLTFKAGRMPAVWKDFQGLLSLSPETVLAATPSQDVRQEFRWVNAMRYTDDDGREHVFSAVQCTECTPGKKTTFAWITNLPVTKATVKLIAQQGGRDRWNIENQGFNVQKNGGYALEHMYGASDRLLQCFYLLLQIAHLIMQLVEKGSPLRHAAKAYGKTVVQLYGSLRNLSRRLLDCLRYARLPPESCRPTRPIQIRLDSS